MISFLTHSSAIYLSTNRLIFVNEQHQGKPAMPRTFIKIKEKVEDDEDDIEAREEEMILKFFA